MNELDKQKLQHTQNLVIFLTVLPTKLKTGTCTDIILGYINPQILNMQNLVTAAKCLSSLVL